MSKSSGHRKGIEVFEFDEDEELVQKESARILKRFPKPVVVKDTSPVTKYTFLERFVGKETTPRQKRTSVMPIGTDSSVLRNSKLGRKGCIDVDSKLQSRYSGGIDDKDEGENTGTISLSASTSTSTESKSSCEKSMESDIRSWKSDTINKMVIVSPDSIMHAKIYCTDSILTFRPNTIKLDGSFIDQNKETFSLEWPVTVILKIESQWCQDVETAIIKVYFNSEGLATSSENESSGVTLLKFTICDSSWFQGEEAIKSLDAKYKALWNVIYDIDSVREDGELLGIDSSPETENCLNGKAKVLVFPKGERDAVSIGPRDMELLQPQRFVNDTIIDFYMKYLTTQIPHEARSRFYFFNSFFFRKLADLDKGTNKKSERQEAFQRVRKWTRNVNLFEKDYIFIPVNFSLHWSLIVICRPGELLNTEDYRNGESGVCTCILHMDSLRGCHKGLRNLFERYLKEELRVRQCVAPEVMALKVSNIKFISLEVPQQENSFDCGLFLLHYVERFLQHSSFCFNMHTSITRDWFPAAEVSGKRSYIWELIHKLLMHESDDTMEGNHGNPHSSTGSPDHDQNQTENASEIEEACSSENTSGTKDINLNENDLTNSPRLVNSDVTPGVLSPELAESLHHTVSKFCSEVAENFSDHIASCSNQDSRILCMKANEPLTSYSSKILSSLRTSWNTGLSKLQGINNCRKIYFSSSPNSPYVAEKHEDEQEKRTVELNNSTYCSTLVEDPENCLVQLQVSEDETIRAVSNGDTSRAIAPFPSCSNKTSLVDCVVQDSESDDEHAPEPNTYKEKDVIDIEDSSKSFKIIDLSNEADDDDDDKDTKPPAKRSRLKLGK